METKKKAANSVASKSDAPKKSGSKPMTAAENSVASKPEGKKKPDSKPITAVENSAVSKPATKKRSGRKPMTAAEKEAAAKVRAQEKAKAESLKPEFIVQYQGADVDLAALAEAAKADFRQVKKRTLVTELKLYVKPEEHTVYYVVNGSFTGSIAY